MRKKSLLVEEAEDYLRGTSLAVEDVHKLAKLLKKENAFKYGRRILARARKKPIADPGLRLKMFQEHALCTYKDPDLSAEERLKKAFMILEDGALGQGGNLKNTRDQETLGLAGAICKRQWMQSGQRSFLERSLAYYMRGYEQFAKKVFDDYGYTGINAAFVLDLLASQEEAGAEETGSTSAQAKERREKAQEIRDHLSKKLPELAEMPDEGWLKRKWWFLVTVAEAFFGMRKYEDAGERLDAALKLREELRELRERRMKKAEDAGDKAAFREAYAMDHVPDWEYESTARQLASLALLVETDSIEKLKETEAWAVLDKFLGGKPAAVESVVTGKVGLGLSGGGFRASLFHIGVLAKLAELDLLRHVEVLSCVSGGSIIGAHYYLELRKLLEAKADGNIERKDYIELVKRVERDFVAGVQKNVRTRVAAELITNLKMIFLPNYSRTERLGELYERHIFSRTIDCKDKAEEKQKRQKKKWWLNRLFVHPMGEDGKPIERFNPKSHNWQRSHKVPTLILNATTLNTGHNWQFTASWMGEPPAAIDTEIDANYRLRRMYYDDAPEEYREVRLGHAVAASSCVPGLFEPLALDGLYERKPEMIETSVKEKIVNPVVRLVDGGVNDNQGVVGLLEQDCSVMIVSDASGQMGVEDAPSRGLIGVPLRANSVLMARVRHAEYQDLKARLSSSLLRGFVFQHLKKDLGADPVDWVETKDPYQTSEEAQSADPPTPQTYYGVDRKVQDRLSAIRTDLDSFTDVEASALMTSAYLMTEKDLSDPVVPTGLPLSGNAGGSVDWHFLQVKDLVKDKADTKRFMKLLKVGGSSAFKIWQLSPPLKVLGAMLGVAALGVFFWASFRWPDYPLITLRWVALFAGLTLVGWVLAKVLGVTVAKTVMSTVRYRDTFSQVVKGVVMAVAGFLVARLHLHVFDKWFLTWGSMDKFVDSKSDR